MNLYGVLRVLSSPLLRAGIDPDINWHLGQDLWLEVDHPDGYIHLHRNRSHGGGGTRPSRSNRPICFRFSAYEWETYNTSIQSAIYQTHHQHYRYEVQQAEEQLRQQDRRDRQRRQRQNSWRQFRERHVRHRSPYSTRSDGGTSSTREQHNAGVPMQVLQRAASDVARLPSTVAPQYSTIPTRQAPSNRATLRGRGARNDCTSSGVSAANTPTSASPSPPPTTSMSDSDASELAQFSNLCTVNDECEIASISPLGRL